MIVIGGENLVDFVQVKQAGELVYLAKPGGSPFNVALALGRQGAPVGYLTPISTDAFGQMLADTLTTSACKLLSVRRSEPTSLAIVSIDSRAPEYRFYRENTAERMVSFVGLTTSTPDSVSAVYLGSLALADGQDAEDWAAYYIEMHKRGIFTALDPNIRPDFIKDRAVYLDRLGRILQATDLLKLSDEDLAWLYPDTSLSYAADLLAKRTSAKVLVVTRGADGAFALHNGIKTECEASVVSNLKDTIGAGDTFTASLLAYLSRNNALSVEALGRMDSDMIQRLLRWASDAAALNCEKDGCDPPYLTDLHFPDR